MDVRTGTISGGSWKGLRAVRPPITGASLPSAPYPGVKSYGIGDQHVFFGRDSAALRLSRLVVVYRGVMLYGASGVGKSSLINARLIPWAIEEGFSPARIRVQLRPDQEMIVERVRRTSDGVPSTPKSTEILHGGVLSAADLLRRIDSYDGPARPLLVFDQFEELVTLLRQSRTADAVSPAMRAQATILATLLKLLTDPSLRVKVVLSFREDYLAPLASHLTQAPDLFEHHLRLAPFEADPGILYNLIRGPFEEHQATYGDKISPTLARDLSTAFIERASSTLVSLSEVQIVCRHLWYSDDPDEEFHRKGVSGVLEGYYQEALGRLGGHVEGAALSVLANLVTEEGTRNIVSEADLIERVKSDEGVPTELALAAIHGLEEKSKLISRERRHDVVFYELVSEYSIPWIRTTIERRRATLGAASPLSVAARQWGRLGRTPDGLVRGRTLEEMHEWARANSELVGGLEQEYLEESRKNEDAIRRRDERRQANIRRTGIVLAVLLVLLTAAALSGWLESGRLARAAEGARDLAVLAAGVAETERFSADLARTEAVVAREDAETERSKSNDIALATQEALAQVEAHLESLADRLIGLSDVDAGAVVEELRELAVSTADGFKARVVNFIDAETASGPSLK